MGDVSRRTYPSWWWPSWDLPRARSTSSHHLSALIKCMRSTLPNMDLGEETSEYTDNDGSVIREGGAHRECLRGIDGRSWTLKSVPVRTLSPPLISIPSWTSNSEKNASFCMNPSNDDNFAFNSPLQFGENLSALITFGFSSSPSKRRWGTNGPTYQRWMLGSGRLWPFSFDTKQCVNSNEWEKERQPTFKTFWQRIYRC